MADKPEWEYAGHQVCREEIQRLQAERQGWADLFTQNMATISAGVAEKDAEIERLQAALSENDRTVVGLGRAQELRAAEIRRLRAVIQKHYPTIAGHVLRLQEAHEDRAAAEWLVVAQDFFAEL